MSSCSGCGKETVDVEGELALQSASNLENNVGRGRVSESAQLQRVQAEIAHTRLFKYMSQAI